MGQSGPWIWGLGHAFEGKLYYTKDLVDDNFVPRNRKPTPIPKPAAKPAQKRAPKGKHVELFKMRQNNHSLNHCNWQQAEPCWVVKTSSTC